MAETPFTLHVLSPQGTVFEGPALSVTLPGAEGEMTVLADHMPVAAALSDGEVRVVAPDGEHSIAIAGGFVEVRQGKTTVLSDFAAEATSIEVARVEAAKKRAEDVLREKKERRDIVLVERDLHRAILQLNVAEKVRRRRAARFDPDEGR